MPRTFPESPLCTLPVRKEITANRNGGRQRRADTPVALLAGLLVLYLSCEAQAQALVIHDAWVRAMPPGQTMTAAYMQLENPGEQAVRVDGVEASEGVASLHETRRRDGRVQMAAVEQLDVPAGRTVSLEPGGLHVMLTGLANTPAAGTAVTLCVTGPAERVCVDAPVRRNAPDAAVTRGSLEHGHHGR